MNSTPHNALFVTLQEKSSRRSLCCLAKPESYLSTYWGLKEASWQPIKSRKRYVVLAVKLFRPFAFVVLLSSRCLPLFLFAGPQNGRRRKLASPSLGESLHTFAEHHAEKINSYQLSGRWLAATAVRLATAIFLTAVQ